MFKFLNKKKRIIDNQEDIVKELERHESELVKLSEEIDNLKKKSRLAVQRVGIIRFNPFPEVGGDQSFSLALLNENNDGVVVTSLYSHDSNRIYAKPVASGESTYQLSEEEKAAIKSANPIK